ncbi:MAG TPA: histidine kinase dimerization/phospho-acceptor domain-containing protein, partial [Trueperaceae bacterium]
MHWEETLLGSKGTFYIGAASVALLVLGFLFDISTSQALVVAITYNIPIALSSLALSRRLTLSLVGAALFANLAAGYINALSLGGVVATAIANRGLAALSYLLAGFLILMLKAASSRITALKLDEARAKREHDLRRMMTQLSGPLRPQAFMEQACGQLRDLLEADAVVVSGLAHNRFAAPRYSDPAAAGFAKAGDVVPWVVAAAPSGKPCVLTGRSDRTTLTVGLWRRQGEPELVVMAIRAKAADANTLLAEALQGLEPLLERAVLLENLDRQRGELSRRNTVIRDLVYAFSHDLRTPLLANAMNMQLALDGAFGDLSAEFRRTLENGLDANEDLLELADSLLLVARYESGELPSKPEPVNLVTVLRQAHARLEPVLEARSLCMRMEAPGTLMVSLTPSRPS